MAARQAELDAAHEENGAEVKRLGEEHGAQIEDEEEDDGGDYDGKNDVDVDAYDSDDEEEDGIVMIGGDASVMMRVMQGEVAERVLWQHMAAKQAMSDQEKLCVQKQALRFAAGASATRPQNSNAEPMHNCGRGCGYALHHSNAEPAQ